MPCSAPLAKVRRQISGFIVQTRTRPRSPAPRAHSDISRSFQLFPEFLRQLRPLMVSLGNLADQGTPLMASLGQSAAALDRQFTNLTPFAKAARPALIALGNSSQKSQPALVATIPLAKRLNKLGHQLAPSASLLDKLTASLNNTGGIEQLMALLFAGVSASNGFDADGHYVRAEPMVGSVASTTQSSQILGCSANFTGPGTTASADAAAAQVDRHRQPGHGRRSPSPSGRLATSATSNTGTVLNGLLHYLIGERAMSFRRRQTSPLGNPILIGALTVLVTIVAVTLAYNANNGLPFVPRYTLHLQIADASEVTKNAEVHMGGALIGVVDERRAGARLQLEQPIAVMNLSLNKNVEPLPVDSTFDVRLKSSIGLKYVQVTKGTSSQTYANGATVPLSQSGSEVDLDQFLSMFDAPTRLGVAASTIGFSDALAGRGAGINDAIGAFVPLVKDLGPVARNLASKKTDFGGFFRGLESFSVGARARRPDAGRPVRESRHHVHGARERRRAVPPAVDLGDAADVQRGDRHQPPHPGVPQRHRRVVQGAPSRLRHAAPERPGPRSRRSPPAPATSPGRPRWIAQLLSLAQHLESYGQNPAVNAGLDRLTLTASSLRSPLAFLTPAQSSCNYVTLFLRNIASTLSDDVITGTALRFNLVAIPDALGQRGRSLATSVYDAETVPERPVHRPSPRQPVPEHRLARTDARVRRRERALLGQGGADRQSAGERRAEDRDDHEAEDVRRHKPRVSSFAAGIIGLVVVAAACYLIFGGALPFSGLAVRAQGGVHEPDAAAHPFARCGSPASTWARSLRSVTSRAPTPVWSRWTSTRTDCRSTPTPPRPSGRGSSSRATSTSTWRRERRTRRSCPRARRCRPPTRPGPVQLDRVLAALTSNARTNLQTLLQGIGASARHARHARRERVAGRDHAQPDRRPGAEQVAGVLDGGVPGLGDRQRGPARDRAARPEQGRRGQRAGVPRVRERAASSSRASCTRSTRRWPRSPRASRI